MSILPGLKVMTTVAKIHGIDLDAPIEKLPANKREILLHGTGDKTYDVHFRRGRRSLRIHVLGRASSLAWNDFGEKLSRKKSPTVCRLFQRCRVRCLWWLQTSLSRPRCTSVTKYLRPRQHDDSRYPRSPQFSGAERQSEDCRLRGSSKKSWADSDFSATSASPI